ncbi:hypothetical protein AOLI_G00194350 [Acnodon oligacanthus]
MAGKATKTRNLATSVPRPSAIGSSSDQRLNCSPIRKVTAELATLKSTTGETEKSLSAYTDDTVTLKQEVAHLKAQSKLLENKCEDLEARARRNNIRIVGVPESQASSTGAISVLLQKAFNLTEVPMLDRSHRSLAPAPRQGEQPRAVVARLHYFQDCANILRLAREKRTDQDGPDDHLSLPRLRCASGKSSSRLKWGETTASLSGGGPIWHSVSSSLPDYP